MSNKNYYFIELNNLKSTHLNYGDKIKVRLNNGHITDAFFTKKGFTFVDFTLDKNIEIHNEPRYSGRVTHIVKEKEQEFKNIPLLDKYFDLEKKIDCLKTDIINTLPFKKNDKIYLDGNIKKQGYVHEIVFVDSKIKYVCKIHNKKYLGCKHGVFENQLTHVEK